MASEDAADYTKTANLATVATSGSYNDLLNKPEIPDVSDYYTKTEVDSEFLSSNQYSQDKYDYVAYEYVSNNLFDRANMMNGKLLNHGGGIGTYAKSILSGYIPVEEGKTYTIYTGDNTGTHACTVGFMDEAKKQSICAYSLPNITQYGGSSGHWPVIDGLVTASYNSTNRSTTFTVLEGSNISYMLFYIMSKPGTVEGAQTPYWGNHDGTAQETVDESIYQIRVNEGSEILPYERGYKYIRTRYGDADQVVIDSVTTQMSDLQDTVSGQISDLQDSVDSQLSDFEDEVDAAVENIEGMLGAKVVLRVEGNYLYFDSDLPDSKGTHHTMTLKCSKPGNSTNRLFEFQSHTLDGVALKGSSDDICPMNGRGPGWTTGSYIGANHGYSNGRTITCDSPHGKDNSDIGSIWLSADGKQVTIYEVPNSTTIRAINCTSNSWTSPLTHVSGATHTEDIVFSSQEMDQMYVACNKWDFHVLDNSDKEIDLSVDGVYKSDKFRIINSYQVLDPTSAVAHLQEMRADGQIATRENLHDEEVDPFVRQNLCYEVNQGCAVTLYQSSDFLGDFTGYHGAVQAIKLTDSVTEANPQIMYVAGAYNNTPFEMPGTPLTQTYRSDWDDPNNPPYRFIQKCHAHPNGFMQGYYTKSGDGIPSIRNTFISNCVFYMPTTGKSYPRLYDGHAFHAGDHNEAVVFYTPFTMDADDDCFAAVYNYVHDDIILSIDYQQAADAIITLRDDCVGKQIEVIDKTDNVTMVRTMAGSKELPITFGGKGWIVLRFYDASTNYVDTDQGVDKAGYFLKVDSQGLVTTVDVPGLVVDSELSTTSTHAIENKAITNALYDVMDEHAEDMANFVYTQRPSINLLDRNGIMDHKLINNGMGTTPQAFIGTYDNSIVSGFIPVEEGKTYTFYSVKSDGSAYASAGGLCFADANKIAVCGCQASSPSTPYGGTVKWTGIEGFVTATYNSATKSNTFTILPGSGIRFVITYITKYGGSGNYWGEHTDLSVIADYCVQVNEGSTILPYEEGGRTYPVPLNVAIDQGSSNAGKILATDANGLVEPVTGTAVANATDTSDVVTQLNALLTSLRNIGVIAAS